MIERHDRIQAAQAHEWDGPEGEVPAYFEPQNLPLKLNVSPEYADLMRRAEARLVHALPQDDGTEPTGQGQSWREYAGRLTESLLAMEADRDGWREAYNEGERRFAAERARADAAERRLAEVRALGQDYALFARLEALCFAENNPSTLADTVQDEFERTLRAVLDRPQGEEEGK